MAEEHGPVDGDSEDAVVVLNFHGRSDTEKCVESLVEGSPEALVVVVDNGSYDGCLEAVSRRWPQVQTLKNRENLGFAGGMNTGLRWALDRGASTVTVLNNDTITPSGALRKLADVARRGNAVSPAVVYADGSGRVWFAGGTVDPLTGLARHLSEPELAALPPGDDGLRPTTTLAGCCVTASKETWRSVGLFDERFFLNFEDSDWSLRASAGGVTLVVDTSVTIQHRVSASFAGAYSYLGLFYYARNGLLFGRERVGTTPRQRYRFVRHHVLPVLTATWRKGDHRAAVRRGVVVAAAILGNALRLYGRAPAWLERRAAAWASPRG